MTAHTIDSTTGLGITLPVGWRLIPSPLVALSAIYGERLPQGLFVPTIVATVVTVEPDEAVQEFTRRTSEALLAAVSSGRIVNIGVWEQGDVEGREVLTTYTEDGRGVIVATYLYVAGGLGTRIDVSFGIWDASTGVELARQVCGDVLLPQSATPTSADPAADLARLLGGMQDV